MPRAKPTCELCGRKDSKKHTVYSYGWCNVCAQAWTYWQKRTPKQLVKRQQNLDVFQRRMDAFLGNVTTTTRKRTRAKAA